MIEHISNNRILAQITFAFILLAAFASRRLNCEALALSPNNAKSLSNRVSYPIPKAKPIASMAEASAKSGAQPVPSILSDYYNNLIANSPMPLQSWPQQELSYVPSAAVGDNEYDNGEEYYSDDNSDALRSFGSEMTGIYGNDVYQPEGWFNGPVIVDNSDSNNDNDDLKDAQLNTLMMAYLLDQFDKLNQLKDLSEKRAVDSKSLTQETISTTTIPSVTIPATKVTTNAIPKKLTAEQIRLVQRGQKEFPLLRPAADNDEKTSGPSDSNWPTELEEKNLSQVCLTHSPLSIHAMRRRQRAS